MKQSEIHKAAELFSRTGEIQDKLIPYFDQNGQWHGDRRNWRKSIFKTMRRRMKRALLHSDRRIKVNGHGKPILLTSFVVNTKSPVVIPWQEVNGSIEIKSAASIAAPILRKVRGHFHTTTVSVVHLPRLRVVKGDLDAPWTWQLQIPQLQTVGGSLQVIDFLAPSLESVGNRLSMRWTQHACAPCLKSVGGDLCAIHATVFAAPCLKVVGRRLEADIAVVFRATKLQTVGRSLEATSATHFVAPVLGYIGGDLIAPAKIHFYNPGIKVRGKWSPYPKAGNRKH